MKVLPTKSSEKHMQILMTEVSADTSDYPE